MPHNLGDENGFLGTLYPNNEANLGINKLESNFSIEKITKDLISRSFGILYMRDLIKVELCLQKLQNHLSEEFIGIIKYPDFALYEGCIKNLKANGIGFFYKPPGNKEFYGGEFSDGVIQGYGIMKENESFGLYKNGIYPEKWEF